ncbi:hypothetical protein TYRP_012245 [Tyrophagus putrescentiae]|nr:hypothetical protein TYRP_012245 [Tyrophagus putrescentiae]
MARNHEFRVTGLTFKSAFAAVTAAIEVPQCTKAQTRIWPAKRICESVHCVFYNDDDDDSNNNGIVNPARQVVSENANHV